MRIDGASNQLVHSLSARLGAHRGTAVPRLGDPAATGAHAPPAASAPDATAPTSPPLNEAALPSAAAQAVSDSEESSCETGGPCTAGTMTLEGLHAAWGESGSMYDLDGNGTVNVNDLLRFLASLSDASATKPEATSSSTPPPAPPPAEADSPAPLTLEGLHAAWGQKDSAYDLNGDGTVNVSDLLRFLSGAGASGSGDNAPPTTPTPSTSATEASITTAAADAPPLTLKGLLAAWGTKSSVYDLDGSGTVNVNDLLRLLSQLGDSPRVAASGDAGSAGTARALAGARPAPAAESLDSARPRSRRQALAEVLLRKLGERVPFRNERGNASLIELRRDLTAGLLAARAGRTGLDLIG
jgi:hypothetical protein